MISPSPDKKKKKGYLRVLLTSILHTKLSPPCWVHSSHAGRILLQVRVFGVTFASHWSARPRGNSPDTLGEIKLLRSESWFQGSTVLKISILYGVGCHIGKIVFQIHIFSTNHNNQMYYNTIPVFYNCSEPGTRGPENLHRADKYQNWDSGSVKTSSMHLQAPRSGKGWKSSKK